MNLIQMIRFCYFLMVVKFESLAKQAHRPIPRYVEPAPVRASESTRVRLIYGPCDGDSCLQWSLPSCLYMRHPAPEYSQVGIYVIYDRAKDATYHFSGYARQSEDFSFTEAWRVGQGYLIPRQQTP